MAAGGRERERKKGLRDRAREARDQADALDHGQPRVEGAAAQYRTGVQREVDRQVERRLAEVMSSAGVNFNRVAIEILYMLPPVFVEAYGETFTRALGSADSGAQARGKGQERTADLARAKVKKTGGQGKRYKQIYVIKDERALETKLKADKRLRALARDMRLMLKGEEDAGSKARCGGCSGFVSSDWRFCPACGHGLMLDKMGEGEGDRGSRPDSGDV
jgi:hypothetical protein